MMKKAILTISIIFLSLSPLFAQQEQPQQFEDFNLTGYSEGGAKAWDVNSDTADVMGNEIEMTNVDANTYGEQKANLKAQTGLVNKESGNMHLEKDVVITTDDGGKLVTNSLDWQKNDDLVTTEDDVFITKEGLNAEGKGAKARPGLNMAQINEDVTVTMKTTSDDGKETNVVITCDGPLEIDYQKEYAVFNRNVVATETDRELKADKMEVFFDTRASEIKQMICTGNVSIKQGKNITYSEKAVYTAKDQKLILSGRPKLILFTEGME